ncbi:MAG TPA: PD-(D/E)XK nuclease family protein, partial [Planctomycetota bacterium]|nr:PD-(D/E)XK nuclease family protein [Planctomycetota bacterium]
LLREQAFAFVQAAEHGGEIVRGAFDRAVVSRAKRCGEIVDFKTDVVEPGNDALLQARAETYRPQLELYRGALARLEALEESRIAMRVCFVGAGRTVELR